MSLNLFTQYAVNIFKIKINFYKFVNLFCINNLKIENKEISYNNLSLKESVSYILESLIK